MISFEITRFGEVDSTNEHIKRLMAQGAPEGTVVIAETQTGGYGRRGHVWSSPQGGLYLSALLRPGVYQVIDQADLMAKLPTLSLACGIAVRRTAVGFLAPRVAQDVKLKWPNDVVVRTEAAYRKLSGISLEGTAEGLCLGIGINVVPPSSSKAGKEVYLAELTCSGECPSVEKVSDALLTELGAIYNTWLDQPFLHFLSEYNEHNVMSGRRVSIQAGQGTIEGEFLHIDEAGRMMIRTEDHGVIPIVSGEAHVLGIS